MTKEKMTKETNIIKALELNPDAADILLNAGLGCLGCSFAHAETLEQGLAAHGFSKEQIDEVIKELNEE